jgi:FSR family fosmidomycin resistance protein-like MFS transporter
MSTVATATDAPRRSFREVWLIAAGHMMTHWYPSTFYLLLPLIGNELGLSFGEIGSILTCQFLAGALSNIPGGMAVDTVGRKGLLMGLALFWVGVPYLIMGFAHSYATLLVCAALVGMGNNFWHPTAIPLLAQSYPARRGLVVSIHGMGGNLGDAVAPLVVGPMLAVLSWRDVVVLNVIPGMVASVLILMMLGRLTIKRHGESGHAGMLHGGNGHDGAGPGIAERAAPQTAAGMMAALYTLLGNRTVLMLSLGSAMRAMTQSTLLTFLPVFLAGELGYSQPWVGGAMFTLQAAGFAATPVAGHLSDRMGRRRIIVSSMAMSAVVLAFMAVAGRSPAFVFFIAFLGFFLFAVRAVLQAWLLDATPRHMGGTSIGIMFGTQALGAAIGPALGGVIADQYGLMATFYFLAMTIVIANMFIFFTPAAEPQYQADSREPAAEHA